MAASSYGVHRSNIAGSIPAVVGGAVTVVFMLLPWLNVPLAQMANYASSSLGAGIALASDYNVFGLFQLLQMYPGASNTDTDMFVNVYNGYTALWAATMTLVVVGAILLAVRGNKGLLIAGAIISAVLALVWSVFVSLMINEIAKVSQGIEVISLPPWPLLTIVAGIVTTILAVKANVGSYYQANASAGQVQAPGYSPQGPAWERDTSAASARTTQRSADVQPPSVGPYAQPASVQTVYTASGGTHVDVANAAASAATPSSVRMANASCICPTCGATVRVSVPDANCVVKITCKNCSTKFPMEVHVRA